MSAEDKILVSLLRAGNSFAFERLYSKYAKKLYHFSFRICRNHEDAEGIVQVVFIKVWENRAELVNTLSFSGYIFRIAKNILVNQLKKKIVENIYLEYLKMMPEDSIRSHDDILHFKELNILVEKYIDEMPEKRKRVFLLSRKEGLSYQEIASRLDISVNTVSTQISKCIKDLRMAFSNEIMPQQ